mgnify:CR=1 FL=1
MDLLAALALVLVIEGLAVAAAASIGTRSKVIADLPLPSSDLISTPTALPVS